MNERFEVCWDWSEQGNAAHIDEHGVSPDEVEQVLDKAFADREPDRFEPERWVCQAYTDAGLCVVVVFDLDWAPEWNCWAVYPVTAFDPEEP